MIWVVFILTAIVFYCIGNAHGWYKGWRQANELHRWLAARQERTDRPLEVHFSEAEFEAIAALEQKAPETVFAEDDQL